MKKALENMGGYILFYIVVILGILLLNMRLNHLNNMNNIESYNNHVAMNN